MSQLDPSIKKDVVSILWLAFGAFTALSLYSYSSFDPSLNSWSSSVAVRNFCGILGSFIADLLYQALGGGSWALVALCARLSYSNFRSSGHEATSLSYQRIATGVTWGFVLMATVSCFLALYWPDETIFSDDMLLGGFVGSAIVLTLEKFLNPTGAMIFVWTLCGVLVLFYTGKSIVELGMPPVKIILSVLRWVKLIFVKGFKGFVLLWTVMKNSFSKSAETVIPAAMTESVDLDIQRPVELSTSVRNTFNKSHSIRETSSHKKALFPFIKGQRSSRNLMETREQFLCLLEDRMLTAPRASATDDFVIEERWTDEDKGFSALDTSAPLRRVTLKKKVKRRVDQWTLPKIDLLQDPPVNRTKVSEAEIKRKAELLTNKLKQFSVTGEVIGAKAGPAVTLFEFKPKANVKISKITELADDLCLALSSESVRIIAPIPGRDVVGIETSNSTREIVYLKDIIVDEQFWSNSIRLPMPLGQKTDGTSRVVDLRRMPHAMVAGSTGSGKSVFTVSFLAGLIFKNSPQDVRLILVDPKRVDLATFDEIPHLLMPIITDTKKAINALRWAIKEMDKRYRSMSRFQTRGLDGFNEKTTALSIDQRKEHELFNDELSAHEELSQSYYYTPQPYIVIVVEEFGDLMAVDKHNVEQSVVRLAQMARACGIHLVLAMQSPRKDVVTGLIKTNIPARISFKVASKMDSRIILDEVGAERLLSRGDMLYNAPDTSGCQRHLGPWLTDEDIERVVEFWKKQSPPQYNENVVESLESSASGGGSVDGSEEFDERYDEILAYVSTVKEVSASLIQRKFRLGYPRAARMIETFESQGVVGPARGSKSRQVLINELK